MFVNLRAGLNSKPQLIDVNEDINKYITNRDRDWYISLYKYNDNHRKQLEEKQTLSGIRDTLTNTLYFDFDSKEDLSIAQTEAIEVANRLITRGFDEDNIGCYFTGGKGFSIEVEMNDYVTPEKFKAIVFDVAGDLTTFDAVVNDPNRIVRIFNTKHQNSGLYKIPLTPEELTTLTIPEIKLLAKNPRANRMLKVAEIPQNIKDIEPMKEKSIVDIGKELTFDITSIDMKSRPKGMDEARWLLTNGFFRSGERNHAMLCLASTYKNQGYPIEHCQALLGATALTQASRTGEEEFPSNELNLIINQVYGPNWQGGQFTTRDPSNWLAKYAVKIGLKLGKEDVGPMQIADVEDEFTDFIKNIEKNTVKTGIPFIDDKMPLTIGTNAAILGSPGSGKTTLALNILKNCSKANMTTVFFSLDMHRKRMFEKIMYDVTSMNRIELYAAFKEGKGKALVAKMKEQYNNIWFYDRPGTKPEDMANYVREVEAHTGTKVKLVMIDYLERVASDKSSDTEASKDVAAKVQDLVMELDVACITLVQPNKNAYSGGPDTPLENMGGIKGSSYLSQSYRNIISLWRPGYSPTLSEYDIFMELALLKNDLGELGKTIMKFDGAKGRILNMEDSDYIKYKELMMLKKSMKAENDDDGWD